MSRQPSKALIGMFVMGAVTLVVIALVMFGKGAFFSQKPKAVMYFEGSVKGLQIGSPVMFRGVPVGQVTDIQLMFHDKDFTILIPVHAELDPEKITVASGAGLPGGGKLIPPLIERGFRAQLQMQSIVTGQLVVNLDLFPGTPVRLVGQDKRYPELPTIPNDFEKLQKKLTELDFGSLFAKAEGAVDAIEKLANSDKLKGSLAALEQTLISVDKLSRNVEKQVDPLSGDIRAALKKAEKAIDSIDKTVLEYKDLANQNKNVGYDVHKTLQEVQALSRALRSLVDYLDRHPEALIRGKSSLKGDPQ